MAEFTPKTAEQILRDAVDYLYHNTNLSDFNVGSVIRTILEVMANEDAEQYFQMSNVLESFFLKTAVGAALDERAHDYGVSRLPATASTGSVVFMDTNLKRSFLVSSVVPGDPILEVKDASEFPAPPFLVKLGEGGQVEFVQISTVTLGTNTLTVDAAATPPFDAITYAHSSASTGIDEVDNLGSLVTLYESVQPSRIIPSGITLRAQPTNVTFPIECLTTEVGTQSTGYFLSNPVKVKSTTVGVESNIPPKRLNQISGGAPYSGAGVINSSAISGGRNAESDGELRNRVRNSVASLSKGTISALMTNLIGITDTSKSQTISRARIVEDFVNTVSGDATYATVYAYVDDSSVKFTAEEERSATDTLTAAVGPTSGVTTQLPLASVNGFPIATTSNKPYVVVGSSTATPSVVNYQATSGLTLTNVTPALLTVDYVALDAVTVCEALDVNTEENKKYYYTNKYPLGDDAIRIFKTTAALGVATELVQLLPGKSKTFDGTGALVEDFIVNEALGQIEFFAEKIPAPGSALFAIYENYAGIIKEAQTVVDGNLLNLAAYPGVRSAGVKVLVRPAKRSPVNITVDLTIDSDLTSSSTASFLVRQVLISYVNNLNIGEDVIVAELIDRAMAILGVINCKIISPSDDWTINHDSVAYVDNIIIL